MDDELQAAIARINAEIARGNLQLNRDIYSNITLPTYRNVTFPSSYAGLTGYLPSEYPGVFHDQPTFGSLMDTAQMFGRAGTDPRFANLGFKPGERTLGGQQLDEQRRQFDTAQGQDWALNTGTPSTIGMGQRLEEAAQALRNNPAYQAAQRSGDTGTLRQMEQGLWQQVTGLSPELAQAASERSRQLIHASGGQLTQAQALEQAVQQGFGQMQRGGQGAGGAAAGGGGGFTGLNFAGSGMGAAGYGPGPISQAQRQLMEQARQFDVGAQLQALQQESQLRADPFALERYRRGLAGNGVPASIAAMSGGVLPSVQGTQASARPNAPSLQAQQQEIQGGQMGLMTDPQTGRPYGGPTFGQPMASAQRQMQALPQLSQINARNYMRLDPSGQRYVNSAYRASGMAGDDDDIYEAVKRGLPQFARRGVPTFGRVS